MANNLRTIKKDVIFLVNELISDCRKIIELHPDKEEEITRIASEAIKLGDETFDKINHRDAGSARSYYKKLGESFLKKIDELFTELGKGIQKKS
ncbi:MAG: hypothetical protein LKI53_05735 [Bacteroidales bacterium]|jgi:hypothetical protein|nr:hypothetical protein [Bacteroidales bacterium]